MKHRKLSQRHFSFTPPLYFFVSLISQCSGLIQADEVSPPSTVSVNKWGTKSWKPYKTITLDHLKGFSAPTIETGTYGGRIDRKENETGFFHIKKLKSGWTMIDPDGHPFYCLGVNSIAPNDESKDTASSFKLEFSDKDQWAKKTSALLREELKFNTLGCWSDWELFKQADCPMPYVRRLNMIATYASQRGTTHYQYGHTGFDNDVIPVFDKEFPLFCDQLAEELKATKNDPWLLGYFSDNELPLKEKGIIKRHLSCPDDDPSHLAAQAWLKKHNKSPKKITPADDTAFCELVIGTYYRITSSAIRKYDPKHMLLGTRFHGGVSNQDVTYKAAGPYLDVISINYYHRWSPEQKLINHWAQISGRPILITEWYAKGQDSGLDNSSGAGFTVRTQRERGQFYENYTIGLLRNKNVVGSHWFRYIDDGPSKKGKSSNKGLLDLKFQPYPELANSMQRINQNVYGLRDYLLNTESLDIPDKPEVSE